MRRRFQFSSCDCIEWRRLPRDSNEDPTLTEKIHNEGTK